MKVKEVIDMQYTVIIEKGDSSYGAYVPDLPGCIAAAETKDEAETKVQETIDLYL
jgi:predicted RNase H-like HicB family nuclease